MIINFIYPQPLKGVREVSVIIFFVNFVIKPLSGFGIIIVFQLKELPLPEQ